MKVLFHQLIVFFFLRRLIMTQIHDHVLDFNIYHAQLDLWSLYSSELWMIQPRNWSAEIFSLECLKCFPFGNRIHRCRILNFKLRGIDLAKTIAYVFSSWHCFNNHLRATDQKAVKTTAFIEEAPTDDQFIRGWWLLAPGCTIFFGGEGV